MGRFRGIPRLSRARSYPRRADGHTPNVNYPRAVAPSPRREARIRFRNRANRGFGRISAPRRRYAKRGVFSKSENELRCFNNGIAARPFQKTPVRSLRRTPSVDYPCARAAPTVVPSLPKSGASVMRENLPHCADGTRKEVYFQNPKNEFRCFNNGIAAEPSKNVCAVERASPER